MSASPTMSMDMGMTSSTMGMMMPTSTSSGMSGSMPGGMTMEMSQMAMVFFTSVSTPLYSAAWTPRTTGQYAATCIFLIAFATIFRALLAIRMHFFKILAMIEERRSGGYNYQQTNTDTKSRPWRVRDATILAMMDVVLAGVSYLLMLAVMTMNVGYFLSILAGVFVGSMIFGHYLGSSTAH